MVEINNHKQDETDSLRSDLEALLAETVALRGPKAPGVQIIGQALLRADVKTMRACLFMFRSKQKQPLATEEQGKRS